MMNVTQIITPLTHSLTYKLLFKNEKEEKYMGSVSVEGWERT